jgi:hypothetical protein
VSNADTFAIENFRAAHHAVASFIKQAAVPAFVYGLSPCNIERPTNM